MNKLNFVIPKNEAQSLSEALSKKGVSNDYFFNGNYANFETSNNLSTLLEVYGNLMFREGVKRGSKNS